MPRDFASRLGRRAAKAGLFPNDDLVERLHAFYELLAKWNEKINLTSLADLDEAIDRLFLEPLAATRYISAGAARLLDVGSGGGSPAIPLKLALPELDLTMVEVKTRKSAFLREAIRQLQIGGARVETQRLEELLPRPDLHERFDLITMRAVRVETKLLYTLQAFLATGGQVLLFRGPSGPDAPGIVVPPLRWEATYPLLESLRSRITILTKRPLRSVDVPRGTLTGFP